MSDVLALVRLSSVTDDDSPGSSDVFSCRLHSGDRDHPLQLGPCLLTWIGSRASSEAIGVASLLGSLSFRFWSRSTFGVLHTLKRTRFPGLGSSLGFAPLFGALEEHLGLGGRLTDLLMMVSENVPCRIFYSLNLLMLGLKRISESVEKGNL